MMGPSFGPEVWITLSGPGTWERDASCNSTTSPLRYTFIHVLHHVTIGSDHNEAVWNLFHSSGSFQVCVFRVQKFGFCTDVYYYLVVKCHRWKLCTPGQVTAICSLCDYCLGFWFIAVIYKLSSEHLTHTKSPAEPCPQILLTLIICAGRI